MILKHDLQQNTFNVHVYQLYYVYVLYYGVYYMKFLCTVYKVHELKLTNVADDIKQNI